MGGCSLSDLGAVPPPYFLPGCPFPARGQRTVAVPRRARAAVVSCGDASLLAASCARVGRE